MFQLMKSKGGQPRLLYPSSLSIAMEGIIRNFPDTRRLKEYSSPKQALQEILKGLLYEEVGKEQERGEHMYKQGKMNQYPSIITLNVNGLNAPIKRHRVAELI